MKIPQYFNGKKVCFRPVDVEKAAPIVAGWTMDLDIADAIGEKPVPQARPLLVPEVKKWLEEKKKGNASAKELLFFGIQPTGEDRLVGLMLILDLDWSNGCGNIKFVFGKLEDMKIFGSETIQMGLAMAFAEMNLFRVSTRMGSNEIERIALLESAGFQLEVRRRKGLYRDGAFVDHLHYGILREEWEKTREVAQ